MDSVTDLVEPVKLEVRASIDNYKKGKAIVAANGVMIETFNPLKVIAKVTSSGGEIQQSVLQALPDGLRWACTCNDQHEFCAHLVATAMVAWEKAPAVRRNKTSEG